MPPSAQLPVTLDEVVRSCADTLAAHGVDTPALAARVLACHVLELDATGYALNRREVVDPQQATTIRALVARHGAGEPVAYITGVREFYGREFRVTPATLIPRPETEVLVEHGLAAIAGVQAPRVADLGAGTGCIGLSIAAERSDAGVTLVETDPDTVAVLCDNAEALGVAPRVHIQHADMTRSLAGRFHCILSNPPYISRAEYEDLHASVQDHEPYGALVGGTVGTEVIAAMLPACVAALEPDGTLAMEIGAEQSAAVTDLFCKAGLKQVQVVTDLAGLDRVVTGRWHPA